MISLDGPTGRKRNDPDCNPIRLYGKRLHLKVCTDPASYPLTGPCRTHQSVCSLGAALARLLSRRGFQLSAADSTTASEPPGNTAADSLLENLL